MALHIGKEIRRVIEKKGITGAWLAEKIGTSQRNLYALLTRSEISTSQLQKISEALEHDFFILYSGQQKFNKGPGGAEEGDIIYERKKTVFVTVELDGQETSLKEWVKKLTAINQIL